MQKKGYFDKHINFFFKTKDASSFFVGMPINFSGFEIGSITSLTLTPKGDVKINFRVKERNHKWLCEDTLLMLEKPLIGSPNIKVMTSLGYPELKKDSELKIIIRDDINDIIINLQPILNEVEHIIHSINIITTNLSSKDGALEKTLTNIENITSKLNNEKALLSAITGDSNATLALNNSLRKTEDIFQNIELLLKNIQKLILIPAGESMSGVNGIIKDIQKKLDTLDSLVNAAGSYDKELLTLKKELHLNLDKTHQLLEKVNTLLMDTSQKEVVLP
jgi:phospholipid/cholesterol/gamma-HCH transport system substrate-binding protein